METAINNLIKVIADAIRKDFDDVCKREQTTKILLKAYNTWQETEHDGVDYIFDLSSREDLKTVIDGGLSLPEITDLYTSFKNGNITQYYLFGQNYTDARPFASKKEIRATLSTYLEEILRYVLAYPSSYAEVYSRYITGYISAN